MCPLPPDFRTLNEIEEELLVARLKAVRKSIVHSGEKGRSLESEVTKFLRGFLPEEYGLSTGFIIAHGDDGPELSTQLDIIIYDAMRCGPLLRLETCEVFPIEAVYGYVEVKASLRSTSDDADSVAGNSIEACIKANATLRKYRKRYFWEPDGGNPIQINKLARNWLALRSYVFAFEPQGNTAKNVANLAKRTADDLRANPPAHLHGIFIANHGYLYTRAVDAARAEPDDYSHVVYTTDHPLIAFKTQLLRALATFPRPGADWAPAYEEYFGAEQLWTEQRPEI